MLPLLVFAKPTLLKEDDKMMHFKASMLISSGISIYAHKKGYSKVGSFLIALGATIAIGYLKEYSDGLSSNHTQDYKGDIKADAMGAGVGAITGTLFTYVF